jgi:valyl-tRNA synthetase
MTEFPSKYNHQEIEQKWQLTWAENKVYNWDSSYSRDKTYVIDTPPPTVSGLLHMGHIFSYTQIDIIARFQRMNGKMVFFPMGFDDNGLPTERLVEKVKKVKASQLPKAEFQAMCSQIIEESEIEFRNLFKSMALSVDWSQEYQTISNDTKKISQMSFLDLFQKNEAYRKMEPVIWDVTDRTALAQADIEEHELKGTMNYIQFYTEDNTPFTVATTRPELLPACVAIFYHPKDARYTSLQGKLARVPLFETLVPLIADEDVDMEKGSGIVMCCTFGDNKDVHWWKKHQLDTKIIIHTNGRLENLSKNAKLSTSVDTQKAENFALKLEGLKIVEARVEIVNVLKEEALLLKSEEISHAVKCAERSKTPIEILITDQWFIKVLDKKEQLLAKANEIEWHPAYMKNRLESWINGLNWDWCISRQRFSGVPFPVWYSTRAGEEGKILTPDINDLPVDPSIHLPHGYTRDEVRAETDVMDTWATSSVTPQISSQAINKDFAVDFNRHESLFPADLRAQAHEIIRTWAFYTITKAYMHEQSIPWHNIMISGWCLASDKTKMSKSKGNVITPIDLIKEQGTDVIRYWTSTSKLGADIAYSNETIGGGKRLINKLWNAAKFAKTHIDKLAITPTTLEADLKSGLITEEIDKWIIIKLNILIQKVTTSFIEYEYSSARQYAENFFWKDFCDNYLEIAKTRAYNEDGSNKAGQQSACLTIFYCIKNILLLFAPIIPHITEELDKIIFGNQASIHTVGSWPKAIELKSDDTTLGQVFVEVLDVIRKTKAEAQLSIKAPISELLIAPHKSDPETIKNMFRDLAAVTSSEKITITNTSQMDGFIPTESEVFFVKVIF